MEKVQKEL